MPSTARNAARGASQELAPPVRSVKEVRKASCASARLSKALETEPTLSLPTRCQRI
jgi:hypothetical protein